MPDKFICFVVSLSSEANRQLAPRFCLRTCLWKPQETELCLHIAPKINICSCCKYLISICCGKCSCHLQFEFFIKRSFRLSMPKVRRSRKPPPEGWELIEPTIEELDAKMREHETEPHEGKRKVQYCQFYNTHKWFLYFCFQ